jgi:hypothetical protein
MNKQKENEGERRKGKVAWGKRLTHCHRVGLAVEEAIEVEK